MQASYTDLYWLKNCSVFPGIKINKSFWSVSSSLQSFYISTNSMQKCTKKHRGCYGRDQMVIVSVNIFTLMFQKVEKKNIFRREKSVWDQKLLLFMLNLYSNVSMIVDKASNDISIWFIVWRIKSYFVEEIDFFLDWQLKLHWPDVIFQILQSTKNKYLRVLRFPPPTDCHDK